jgi:hypothetical protein
MIAHALIHFSDPVVEAIKARIKLGFDRYGTYLHTHDGRNTQIEIWQEIVDALYYSIKGSLEAPALSVEAGQYRFIKQTLTALIKVLSCWEDQKPCPGCTGWSINISKIKESTIEPPTDRRVVLMLDRSSPDAQLRNKWTAGYFDDGEWYRSDDGRKVAVECWAEIPDLSGVGL